jgi:small-conductance mechanosensitive channel
MSDATRDAIILFWVALLSIAGAVGVQQLLHHMLVRLGRREPFSADLARRAYRPARFGAVVVGGYATLNLAPVRGAWHGPALHVTYLAGLAAGAWLIGAVLMVVEDRALARLPTDVRDNRHARQVHTQVRVLRRITVVVLAVVAVGAMLMTFPTARTAGRSLLFSASVAGVIAAFAAQSLLGNLFAGMQLAFSGAIKFDDVVVVEGEWGRVEELTLTYVVVRIWDDRRLVVPASYFASKPFQNWTRNESSIMGTVEIDVDWTVPVDAMRRELERVAKETSLWDGRVCLLQVTEATGPTVRLRCLVSATDAATMWDLRCLVRERLVDWVRDQQPGALPRLRAQLEQDGAARRQTAVPGLAPTDGIDNNN